MKLYYLLNSWNLVSLRFRYGVLRISSNTQHPLESFPRRHGLSFHLYADDTPLYVTVSTTNLLDQQQGIGKTIQIRISSVVTITFQIISQKLKVVDASLASSPLAKHIGVLFDTAVNIDAHINATCKKGLL